MGSTFFYCTLATIAYFLAALFKASSILAFAPCNFFFVPSIFLYLSSSSFASFSLWSLSFASFSSFYFYASSYLNAGSYKVFWTSLSLFLTSSVIEPNPSKSSLSSSSSSFNYTLFFELIGRVIVSLTFYLIYFGIYFFWIWGTSWWMAKA